MLANKSAVHCVIIPSLTFEVINPASEIEPDDGISRAVYPGLVLAVIQTELTCRPSSAAVDDPHHQETRQDRECEQPAGEVVFKDSSHSEWLLRGIFPELNPNKAKNENGTSVMRASANEPYGLLSLRFPTIATKLRAAAPPAVARLS
jgi:hypothetical protein